MAQIVTLDLGEEAATQSQELLADIQAAQIAMETLARVNARSRDHLGDGMNRHDFRQHAEGTFDGVDFDGHGAILPMEGDEPTHWLLKTIYGRDVLKTYLALFQPKLKISKWRNQPELDVELEKTIDQLGLRNMPEPKTFGERLRYLAIMSKLTLQSETADAVSLLG